MEIEEHKGIKRYVLELPGKRCPRCNHKHLETPTADECENHSFPICGAELLELLADAFGLKLDDYEDYGNITYYPEEGVIRINADWLGDIDLDRAEMIATTHFKNVTPGFRARIDQPSTEERLAVLEQAIEELKARGTP